MLLPEMTRDVLPMKFNVRCILQYIVYSHIIRARGCAAFFLFKSHGQSLKLIHKKILVKLKDLITNVCLFPFMFPLAYVALLFRLVLHLFWTAQTELAHS